MDKARAELGRDLAHAVRTGPFSAVLHLAIEDRGMRLEEIQERLAVAGVRISLTMLNYWRRGRSQPERPESIKAVSLLEGILSLPAQSLLAQLGPRRPRGRWPAQPPGKLNVDRLFANSSVISMIKELDSWMYHELTRVSMHDVYLVGPKRQELGLICRQVMRANIDRVSRSVGIFHSDDLTAPITINALRNCRIGRVHEVWIGSTQGAHLLACEVPPGLVGMRWEWQ